MNNTRFKSNICKFIGNVYKDMLNNFELRFNVLIYYAACMIFDQNNFQEINTFGNYVTNFDVAKVHLAIQNMIDNLNSFVWGCITS